MTQPTLSQQLVGWAVATNLTEAVEADIRRRVLDSLGIQLAASATAPEASAIAQAVADGSDSGQAIVIGSGKRRAAASAALINGTLAHALDFDDTHLPSVLHPSATVIPAVLAVAQEREISDDRLLLTAIAVGIEITNRLGMGSYDPELRNSVMFEHGFHATSICGALGSSVAVGLLVGLDEPKLVDAIGIAASMGSGLIEANRTGGSVKKMHCGWAAQSGIRAMQFASAGLTGPPTALEGRFGFYEAFGHGFLNTRAVVGELGDRWETTRTHFKPYPSNHFTHPVVDAALEFREKGVQPEDIASVRVGVAAPTLRTIAEPPDIKARPPSPYAAQFSAPFVFAQALRAGGGLGIYLDDFTDASIADPQTLELAKRVECYADDYATDEFPSAFAARVLVSTNSGDELETLVSKNRGGPGRPLSDQELTQKFHLNATRTFDRVVADQIQDVVFRLGAGVSSELFEILGSCHD